MAEFTELFPMGKQLDELKYVYQYIFTINFQSILVVCVIVTLFFFIFYQIFHGMFFWFLELRLNNELLDLEGANYLTSGAAPSNNHVTLFQVLLHTNSWNMADILEEGDFDKERGPKLRALMKLPPLVRYGMHGTTKNNDCPICLEDFNAGQFCQIFPSCKHMYHSNCIDSWLKKKLTCPVCRSCIVSR
ncbi:hypothetical protein HN51_019920 [Arachis hypogaea]|uniref:RING-type domain-containing protein n=1 Tax=Arachis hypogaea TaxID=3818 RepID=A0A445BZ98_ARAHY|nr:hypothetical protein Ahy_A08g040255 [Arachis hypogaea]